jgi:kynurenine formamidase
MGIPVRWLDLSRPLEDKNPVYPGDPEFILIKESDIKKDGYTLYRIETGNHTGTHIDGPLHILEEGRWLSDFTPESFSGEGVLIDVRGEEIIYPTQEALDRVKPGSIVLFLTGHSAKWNQLDYYKDHPVLSTEYAEALAVKKVKMVGLDNPSVDYAPFLTHKILLGSEILIIEELYQLEALLKIDKFEVYAFPIPYQADSAPARVMAKLLEE